MTERQLVALAQSMLEKSYSPYSRFPVGAALEAEDGRIFTGCNIENAAYGCCICAERTAVFKAVSEGCLSFRRIAIAGRAPSFCYPCGSCRQVLSEFAPELEILAANGSGEYDRLLLSDLLPRSFGPHSLNQEESK